MGIRVVKSFRFRTIVQKFKLFRQLVKMKFNLRIFVLVSAIFAAALTTHSSASEAKSEDEERQLASLAPLLGPLLGLFAGLALGRAFGGIGRGRRRCGRSLDGNDNPLDKIEEDLMKEAMEVMMETAEEQCYERMICDISSRDQHFDCDHFKDFMSFVTDDGDNYVNSEYAEFHGKLKEAHHKGESSGDSELCEATYECPLTGQEMAEMMRSQFEEDDE